MENTQIENTQNKPMKFKQISYYHKYNCEPCSYHTNNKNSYGKHIKSAKHLSLFPKEEKEIDINVVEQKQQVDDISGNMINLTKQVDDLVQAQADYLAQNLPAEPPEISGADDEEDPEEVVVETDEAS